MATIFTTFDDVKQYIAGNANNELPTIEPHLDEAAQNYLIPYLSKAEYDLLVTNYTGTLTAAQVALLPYARRVLVAFGYYTFSDVGTMSINDMGLTRIEDDQAKAPYQWMVRKFQEGQWSKGWQAIEDMIKFLYTNKANYTLWAASQERINFNKMFVWNASIFRQYNRINNLGTLQVLYPNMQEIEELIISKHITSTLYESMLTALMANNMTEDDLLLLPFIERLIVFGTLADIAENFGFEFGINGLQVASLESNTQSSDKRSNAVNQARQNLKDGFTRQYNRARALLVNFLDNNASSTRYVSYYNTFVNITTPETTDNNTNKGIVFFGL